MAIQVDLTTSNYGVPFAGAYFRIATASVTRQRTETPRFSVMIDVVGYATQPTNEDVRDVDFRRYHVALETIEAQEGETFLAKCYVWAMAQEDMAGSIAV